MWEPGEKERHEKLRDDAVSAYLRRTSIMFVETAISVCVTHMTIAEVKEILRKQIEMLEEYG
jgi:hypothetical protein